jgi:hypothetical protein
MKLATSEAKARGVYAILFIVSLPIPLFHQRALGEALWAIRYPWGLHPFQNLSLWHLGRLSVVLPVSLLALLIASWRYKSLCTPKTIMLVAVGMCIFTVIYAINCALALLIALSS